MGCRGRRNNLNQKQDSKEMLVIKKTRNNNKHRELCLSVASWLRQNRNNENLIPRCQYATVELVTSNNESPDVFGWIYWCSILIEVKVSHADFLKDAVKFSRIYPNKGIGEFRYYCCPNEVIKENEVPLNWGLIYENDGVFTIIKTANRMQSYCTGERAIFNSILRRENIKPQIFNYRKIE